MAKKEVVKGKEQKKETKNKKSFFKGFKAELKKVSWPTPKQLINNTIAVIIIVIVTGLIVIGLDIVFEFASSKGVEGIKGLISENENTVEEQNVETDTNVVDENNVNTENVEGTENVTTTENVDNTVQTDNVTE